MTSHGQQLSWLNFRMHQNQLSQMHQTRRWERYNARCMHTNARRQDNAVTLATVAATNQAHLHGYCLLGTGCASQVHAKHTACKGAQHYCVLTGRLLCCTDEAKAAPHAEGGSETNTSVPHCHGDADSHSLAMLGLVAA